jgi:hypothetical protein
MHTGRWWAIGYREEALLVKAESGDLETEINIVDSVAHEIAHQWCARARVCEELSLCVFECVRVAYQTGGPADAKG